MNFLKNIFSKKPKNLKTEKQKTISYGEYQTIKRNRKKGLTRYFFGEHHLWALNEKNATEKAIKKGWITVKK